LLCYQNANGARPDKCINEIKKIDGNTPFDPDATITIRGFGITNFQEILDVSSWPDDLTRTGTYTAGIKTYFTNKNACIIRMSRYLWLKKSIFRVRVKTH